MEIIEPVTHVEICRDPDDNKFLECAKDSHALYIVSGDKDLLVIEQFENIQIVTAKDFCEKYFYKKKGAITFSIGIFIKSKLEDTFSQQREKYPL